VTAKNEEEISMKAAFKEFFIWFLKERYLRYLILEGKMDQKKAYIDYKNTILMNIIKAEDPRETSSSEMGDSFESSEWLILYFHFKKFLGANEFIICPLRYNIIGIDFKLNSLLKAKKPDTIQMN